MSQQPRLLQHVHRLAKFEPRITAEAIDVPSLVAHIRRIFDEHHPAHTRAPPVTSHQHAADPLCQLHGSIWNGAESDSAPVTSLRACCQLVFIQVLGVQVTAYCQEQSYTAISSIRHALIGAYLASHWCDLSQRCIQENIVWHVLGEHLTIMKLDLQLLQQQLQNEGMWDGN